MHTGVEPESPETKCLTNRAYFVTKLTGKKSDFVLLLKLFVDTFFVYSEVKFLPSEDNISSLQHLHFSLLFRYKCNGKTLSSKNQMSLVTCERFFVVLSLVYASV